MKNLNITDIRVLPGDSGFLIDDGRTAILYDSGFGFTAAQMVERIQQKLGVRKLDYIFLTHSHYDHALGSAHIAQHFPSVKIVADEYTKAIFQKQTAKAVMQELDKKYAAQCGYESYDAFTDLLRVDIAVQDGDLLDCGTMHFKVIGLPGHTRCSIGFYLEENELLLATETLGVYVGKNTYLPSYLVGYELTMDSFRKALSLNAKRILIPHYGVVEYQEALDYLKGSKRVAEQTAQWIMAWLAKGFSHAEILELLKQKLYLPQVAPVYPFDAFRLNTSIMIRLIEHELNCTP